MRWSGLGLGLVVWLAAGAAEASPRDYRGYVLAEVEIQRVQDLRLLRELGAEILDDRPGPGSVSILVGPKRWSAVAASDLSVRIISDDVGQTLHEHRLQLDTQPPADATGAFFDGYRTYEEVDGHLDTLAEARPDLVTVLDVGTSLEGRAIRGVSISAANADAPVMLINATQHAREWIATMTGSCVADELVTRADEPAIADLLSSVHFVVVPIVNPDGYVYSWTDDRFWRKNRRDGVGVDLNRNFSVAFGGPGASGDPQAGNYHGTEAFSEPEAAALRDLALSFDHLAVHLDIHSFGQLVLHPWSYTADPAPALDTLGPLSADAAEIMTAAYGIPYEAIPAVELYPASGTAPDWTYGTLGSMSFTFELRPKEVENFHNGFELGPDEIELVCIETMGAVEHLAAWAAESAPGTPGDSGDPPGTTTGSTTSDTATTDGGAETSGTGGEPTSTSGNAGTNAGASSGVTNQTGPAGDSSGSTGLSSSDTDAEPEQSAEGNGCSCRATPAGPGLWWLLLIGLARRRVTVSVGLVETITR